MKIASGEPNVIARVSPKWMAVGIYVLAFVIPFSLTLWRLNPWSPWAEGVFQGGGDYLWIQAMTEAAAQTGPVGTTLHLGWPVGFSQWSHPQLGIFYLCLAWTLMVLLGMSSAGTVWFILAVSAGLASICTVFLFRSLVGNRLWGLSLVLAWALCTSPYVWMKAVHTNVACFFLIPLVFAVILRIDLAKRRTAWVLLSALIFGSFLSPLWWVVVALLMVAVLLVVQLVRRSWTAAKAVAAVIGAILLGAIAQFLILQHFAVPGAPDTRGPWDSNVVGGHLTDLLLASPFVNAHVPWGANLQSGGSSELGFVGFIGGAAAIFAVVVVFRGIFDFRGGARLRLLGQMTLIALLFFITGGLGNLQAAVAVVLGGSSPARAWSRLTIVLALLGCVWALVLIDAWRQGRKARNADHPRLVLALFVGFTMLAVGVGLADTAWSIRVKPTPKNELPEFGAVMYLSQTRAPCPVAQLPQDGFPRYRVESDEGLPIDINKYPWRGFVPYLLAPNFSWSFTSWIPTTDSAMNRVGPTLDVDSMKLLEEAGFCAVLFDKFIAEAARQQDIPMEGRDLARVPDPDFDSERYSVFTLARGD